MSGGGVLNAGKDRSGANFFANFFEMLFVMHHYLSYISIFSLSILKHCKLTEEVCRHMVARGRGRRRDGRWSGKGKGSGVGFSISIF